jgi:hypothetical protein
MDARVLTWVVIAAAVLVSIGIFASMPSCAPNEVRVRAVFGTACVVGH